MKKKSPFKNPARYKFWMNPYIDAAFTKCPKCNNTTKVKTIPLVINADNKGLINLNIDTKYCPYCDLIIAKQQEIKNYVSNGLKQDIPADKCFVFGTLDSAFFRKTLKNTFSTQELFDNIYPIKDMLTFTVQPAGWYFTGKKL